MSFHGALVRKAAILTGANYSSATAVAWDQEVYDIDDWHDNTTNNSRLTVPASLNGQYGRFTACIATQNQATQAVSRMIIRKNGSAIPIGLPDAYRNNRDNFAGYTNNGSWFHCSSGPVLLTTGDYYEVFATLGADASVDIRTESGFSVYVINVNNRLDSRCLARKNATLTNQNFSTLTAQSWDIEDYDTDSIHDTVTNNTRLTIPSVLNNKFVIVHGQIRTQNNTGAFAHGLGIRKSGSSYTYDGFGGASWEVANLSEAHIQCCTHPIQVATNDYFELMYANQDTTVDIHAGTSAFGLYCVGN
jgi:hypothetical protein